MSLFNEFTTYYHGNSDILPEKNNRIYRCVVNSIKGIPVVIETACIQDTINTIEYHEQPPLIPKNDSKEFIRPELNRRCVEVICSKDTDIRGYQEIDATTGRYIIKIRRRCHSADAILSHADEQYKYSEALESGYLVHEDGLGEIDANDVKKEEVKTHATGAERLVIVTPKRFEEGDEQLIPRNCAIVSGNDFCIQDTINTIEYHEQPPLIPKNDSKEFIRPELNRRCVEVICSKDTDIRGYQEIDATTGRYIIKIRRRCHSADAILSHADEQYKYSEALESGYLVHEDGLGEIDANDVKKEEVKTHATGAERLVIVTPKRIAAEILDD
ncbi:14618_t:CDS:2 [Entrophospora sp. SA101]|nr:14618_t:CDS:2 [Entrophospora sp. SA101]